MLKHIIYLVLICCFTTNSNAQSAPGLLGKRILVSYDFNSHFNFALPLTSSPSPEVDLFNTFVTFKHIFGAEYVLSRTLSIGADYGFGNQRLSDYTLGESHFMHTLKTNEIGVRLKYFITERSGSIAPIGPYLQFRLMYFDYLSEMELVLENTAGLNEPYIFPFEKSSSLTGSFGFGRQGILFGKVMYNVGCEMAIVISESAEIDNFSAEEDIRNALLLGNLYKLKLGIVVPVY